MAASYLASTIALVVVFGLKCGVFGTSFYRTLYVEDFCRGGSTSSVFLDKTDGALIYSQRNLQYQENDSCMLFLHTAPGAILYVRSEQIRLEDRSNCLMLIDSQEYTLPNKTQCGDDSTVSFNTTHEYLIIQMSSHGTVGFQGFRLVVTPLIRGSHCGSEGLYRCYNGDCYGPQKDRDGHRNCIDNSDEVGMPSYRPSCPSGMVSCDRSRRCIASSWACDRFVDCSDLSDENHCEYNCSGDDFGDFQCRDGNGCYYQSDKCNSYPVCQDKSDDIDCDSCLDGDSAFYCPSSRQCVSSHQVCDGVSDCENGEDEDRDLPRCNPSIWWYWTAGQLAGVFIGYIIFLVVVIVIVAVVHMRCRK